MAWLEGFIGPADPAREYAADMHDEFNKPPGLVFPIWDLNEDAVWSWWEAYKAANSYNLVSANCSTIVFLALQAGGALNLLSPEDFIKYCRGGTWTPGHIADLMMALQGGHIV